MLLAGDESALPAIGAILAGLPAGVPVKAWIEVSGPADLQPLPTDADADVTWLFRDTDRRVPAGRCRPGCPLPRRHALRLGRRASPARCGPCAGTWSAIAACRAATSPSAATGAAARPRRSCAPRPPHRSSGPPASPGRCLLPGRRRGALRRAPDTVHDRKDRHEAAGESTCRIGGRWRHARLRRPGPGLRRDLLNDTAPPRLPPLLAEGVERVAARIAGTRPPVHRHHPRALGPAGRRDRPRPPARRHRRRARRARGRLPARRRLLPPPPLPRPPQLPGGHPGAARRGGADRRQLLAGHLGPERRRHPHRAAPDRLDGRPHRPRPGRRRRLHQRRHPVQPPGAAAGPRGGRRPRAPPPRTARRCCRGCASSPPRPATSACRSRPNLLGLGPDAVVTVATDADRRMRTAALAARAGPLPPGRPARMAVVATAGTTDFGTIDPLPRDRRPVRRRPASGCTSTPRTAAGCWSRPPAGTCSTASSAPTRSPSTTTSPSSSRSAPAPCWCATAPTLRHATYHADYLNPARDGRAAHPQPGRQEPADHPPLRRAQALDDAADRWAPTRIGALFDEVVDLAAEAWRAARRRPALRGRRPARS